MSWETRELHAKIKPKQSIKPQIRKQTNKCKNAKHERSHLLSQSLKGRTDEPQADGKAIALAIFKVRPSSRLPFRATQMHSRLISRTVSNEEQHKASTFVCSLPALKYGMQSSTSYTMA